ncbi:triphosphoribosyl-dephospho-CoA synthase CitG [Clostridium sardiniense]|uniref:triphosphoribosyl-dephospho-CoA synthase CitG n=1 Tax=Clostridium sardiniense TaxID=29369 RepID=UPI00195CDAC0|nr:triphosphoribosyl-dephospho-CoA synthase CitG [Clostridium sardiniense]MBM7836075.1 triphosphoribosyl-dephospho-CoA synthase [Clostridium sardiniense]
MKVDRKLFIEKATSLIIKSLLYEVSCYPSPGLVSPVSTGAHNDMDYYTFIDSISEIGPLFKEIIEMSMSQIPLNKLLSTIRPIGINIEDAMFTATKKINTHKGLIFLLGVVAASVSRAFYNNLPFNSVHSVIKEISSNLVENELCSKNSKNTITYGEKIFKKYGITGIRGEVEKGLPTVFNHSLPFYEKYSNLKTNQRLYLTLICIMAHCEDSTLLHRHNIDVLEEVNTRSTEILNLMEYKNLKSIEKEVIKLDKEFSERKISPGGSADLLAVTVFLDGIKDYFPL